MSGQEVEELRRALVLDILTCDEPQARLLHHLGELDARQDLATQAAVFEQVASRVDVVHFWILQRLCRVYADLGRRDLAFLVAAMGARICDHPGAVQPMMREMFAYHRDRGEARAAVAAFVQQAELRPEQPVAARWEVERLAEAAGMSLDPPDVPTAPGARRDHDLHPAELWSPDLPAAAASRLPVELTRMAIPRQRNATVVAELPDAELLIRNDSLVTVDRDGRLHIDLSLGAYPGFLRDRVDGDATAERLELDEAVVLLDPFPSPNLGHFLLDQLPRLELYRQAGSELSRAMVVAPRLRAGFQQELASRVPVAGWLATDCVSRVRVGRLWVSVDCRELQHPAQLAAPWNLAWLRGLLDAASAPGHRRLFISRAGSTNRVLMNEAALVATMQAHGYEVIVPGRMAYAEQLAAFRDASHVVACHGAALAHLAVCAPGTHVLEMFHPLYGSWTYAALAQAADLRYAALVGRDGVSDAPELNDLEAAGPLLGRFGDRSLRVDPAELSAWLEAAS